MHLLDYIMEVYTVLENTKVGKNYTFVVLLYHLKKILC